MSAEIVSPTGKMHFVVDDLPLETCLTLPSIGIDFGSAFVRTAVVRQANADADADANTHGSSNRIAIDLATFAIQNVHAALLHAKTVYAADSGSGSDSGSGKHDETQSKLGVYYTGHASEERVKAIREAFPNAAEIKRRDKLDCHNKGAQLLIHSKVPAADLYHDTSAAEEVLRGMMDQMEMFKLMMPPKLLEVLQTIQAKVNEHGGENFPATLSILGSNHILSKLESDATYKVVDVRACGGSSMEALWKLADPEHFINFETHLKLAEKGNRRKVDSLTSEIAEAKGFYGTMPQDYPIFNFGKMEVLSRHQVAAEDLARAVLGMHTDLIFGKAFDISFLTNAFPLYYAGSLIQHEFIRSEMLLRFNILIMPELKMPKFFRTDATAALGACSSL